MNETIEQKTERLQDEIEGKYQALGVMVMSVDKTKERIRALESELSDLDQQLAKSE